MNQIEAGWIALLFDTEGSFSLSKGYTAKADRPAKRGFSWVLNAHVVNTYRPLVDKAQQTCDGLGHVSKVGSQSYRPDNKDQYTWTLRRKEMVTILPQIIPYLMEKKERAELLLEAATFFVQCTGPGSLAITPFRDRRLETIFWRMRALNAKTKNGEAEVLEEERKSGHMPYSREQWESDSKRILEDQAKLKYENQLQRSRAWKRRNVNKMREYWQDYYTKNKEHLNAKQSLASA